MRTWLPGLGLSLLSVILTVALLECVVRWTMPRYGDAAQPIHERDTALLWAGKPYGVHRRRHPDTGIPHTVMRNGLGLRQNREIPYRAASNEKRIGVFGDSYVENARLPAPYAFTEVLDYLLNLGSTPVNVLNFGVSGYGPDQSYLTYRLAAAAGDLDVVVYVYVRNDIRNLYENDLFALDDRGRLVRNPPPVSSWYLPVLARSALTYLVLDARAVMQGVDMDGWQPSDPVDSAIRGEFVGNLRRRRQGTAGARIERLLNVSRSNEEIAELEKLFRELLATWRAETERRGARFIVVLLPSEREHATARLFQGYEIVDLHEEFAREPFERRDYAEHRGGVPWRFRRDWHWNEFGNQLAAVHLYDDVARSLGLPVISAAEMRRALFTYYRAFAAGWQPTSWVEPTELAEGNLDAIRRRYDSLNGSVKR